MNNNNLIIKNNIEILEKNEVFNIFIYFILERSYEIIKL